MGDLTKTKYSARSIAKEEDFTYGETAEIQNLSILLEQVIKSTNNFIITGGEISQRATPSMNVEIAPILAFNKATGNLIYSGSILGPISLVNGGAADRIDIIEVRAKETDYDAKIRAFKDPATGVVSYQSVDTKIRYEMESQIVQGTEGSGNAPSTTSGWIKLAEILVSAGESTSILNADITNASATQDNETDTGWTTDKTSIYRLKGISELKTMFRIKHEENGDHKNDVIRGQHIDWGAGTGQVDADLIPLGTAVTSSPTGGTATNLTNIDLVRAAIQEVFNRLKDASGIANDSIDSRHYKADSIDDEHINWGTGAGQVDADVMPLGTAITNSPTGGTSTSLVNSSHVRAAIQEVFNRLKDASGIANDSILPRHLSSNALKTIDDNSNPIGTIKMFDANKAGGSSGGASGAWVDNSTIPGWYACISGNSIHGCPNLTDRFIMGKVVTGGGATSGNNTHTITTAELPKHTHTINHDHTSQNTDDETTNHYHNIMVADHNSTDYGNRLDVEVVYGPYNVSFATYYQSYHHHHQYDINNFTGSSGDGGFSNTAIDVRPAYYSVIFIRKCS